MKKILTISAIILGLVFIYFGYIYITHTANTLPVFMPGYQADLSTIHLKHSIASFLLGIACFIFAWFQSGKKNSAI